MGCLKMSSQKPQFSTTFNDALTITAIANEMARSDNWRGIAECLAIKPKQAEIFTRYAHAALLAIRHAEDSQKKLN